MYVYLTTRLDNERTQSRRRSSFTARITRNTLGYRQVIWKRMANTDQQELDEIRSLRRQGLLTQQQAYERHMALLAAPSQLEAKIASAPPAPAPGPPPRGTALVALQLLALTLAVLGGAFGIVGAITQELRAGGGGVLLAFTGAPLIEEALKPAGIYLLLIRWPRALLGRLHTAALTAISGLCFGLIESYVYVHVYNPGGDAGYRLYRYTVPVTMHVIASFTVGLGLNRSLIDWAAGRGRLQKSTRNLYLAGVALHVVYNVVAVVLALTGVLSFD
jgi:hypothetical protein